MVLYSTHCPKCKILETKLKQADLQFAVVDDVDEMKKMGITSAPLLVVDGVAHDFNNAIKWLKERDNEKR